MAQYKICLVTRWVGIGTEENPLRPEVLDSHSVGMTDVTGTPVVNLVCDPNAVVVEVIAINEQIRDEVLADPDIVELWTEQLPEIVDEG